MSTHLELRGVHTWGPLVCGERIGVERDFRGGECSAVEPGIWLRGCGDRGDKHARRGLGGKIQGGAQEDEKDEDKGGR